METKTLGQSIGIVGDSFKVTNNAGNEVQLRVRFDYSTCSDADIKSWLNGNRRIAFQRPVRSLSTDELGKLDGQIINANECGRKVESREERIQKFVNTFIGAGLPEEKALELATAAIDNPQLLSIK